MFLEVLSKLAPWIFAGLMTPLFLVLFRREIGGVIDRVKSIDSKALRIDLGQTKRQLEEERRRLQPPLVDVVDVSKEVSKPVKMDSDAPERISPAGVEKIEFPEQPQSGGDTPLEIVSRSWGRLETVLRDRAVRELENPPESAVRIAAELLYRAAIKPEVALTIWSLSLVRQEFLAARVGKDAHEVAVAFEATVDDVIFNLQN
jgi:hypothetical protein